MEDTSIEAISADTGKPKKQLPKNFRKFFFVAAVILSFVAGYLIGGASNREKIADQKRGLDEQLSTIASLEEQIQELQKAAEPEAIPDPEDDEDVADHDEYDDDDTYSDDYSDEDEQAYDEQVYYDDCDTGFADTEEDILVYITNSGERYHRATCSSLSHSSYEVTLSEAMDAGYTPCKNCHPPTK